MVGTDGIPVDADASDESDVRIEASSPTGRGDRATRRPSRTPDSTQLKSSSRYQIGDALIERGSFAPPHRSIVAAASCAVRQPESASHPPSLPLARGRLAQLVRCDRCGPRRVLVVVLRQRSGARRAPTRHRHHRGRWARSRARRIGVAGQPWPMGLPRQRRVHAGAAAGARRSVCRAPRARGVLEQGGPRRLRRVHRRRPAVSGRADDRRRFGPEVSRRHRTVGGGRLAPVRRATPNAQSHRSARASRSAGCASPVRGGATSTPIVPDRSTS